MLNFFRKIWLSKRKARSELYAQITAIQGDCQILSTQFQQLTKVVSDHHTTLARIERKVYRDLEAHEPDTEATPPERTRPSDRLAGFRSGDALPADFFKGDGSYG